MIRGAWTRPILRSKESRNICTVLSIQTVTHWICLQRSETPLSAKRFLRKALNSVHTQEPRVINVDKNAAYPKAIDELKADEELSLQVELRQNKYLNNRIEQDHRAIKRLVKPGMGNVAHSTPQDEH